MMQNLAALPASMWCTVGGVAFAVLLAMALWRTPWGRAGAWLSLAFAGQACSFQLLAVGNLIRLQLFYDWPILLGTYRRVFLVALALQTVLVMWGSWKFWSEARPVLRRVLSWPQGLLFLALLGFSATTIAPEVAQAFVAGPDFPRRLVSHLSKVALALWIHGTAVLNLFLVAVAIPDSHWKNILARWRTANRSWLPWACAVWVVLVASVLHWVALDGMPHVPDEAAYLFHAKYLATGHLWIAPPPDTEAITVRFTLVDGGRWYVTPPAGWAFVLAIGVWLGAPWVINPLLGGIAVLLAHRLARALYSVEVADATAMLLAGSPFLLFMSASFMMHPLTLVLSLLCLLGVWHVRETGHLGWAVIAGLAAGGVLHIRPLDAVALGAAAGIWWLSGGRARLRLKAMTLTLAAGLAMVFLFLAYNKSMTGDPFLPPIVKYADQVYYPGGNRLGFGRDVGNFGWVGIDALPGHGPVDVVMNTNQNLYMADFDLFGWPCGSLFFFLLCLAWGRFRADSFMWLMVLSVVAFFSLYWFSGGPDFGPRYWYMAIVPLVILTVRSASQLRERLSTAGVSPILCQRVWALVAAASLLGLTNLVPWRSVDKYRHYRGVRSDIRRLAKEYGFGHSLVLIRGEVWSDYASAFIFNPPDFSPNAPGTVYAREGSADSRERLTAFYSDRPVWVVAGPSVTKDGFQVVEGPIPPTSTRPAQH